MLPVILKHNMKRLLERSTGLSISSRQRDFELVRNSFIEKINPGLVIDCGANAGQWGLSLKSNFPQINLVSFEPYSEAFKELTFKTEKYPNWTATNVALSAKSGSGEINIASNKGMSSSLNEPELHVEVHGEIKFLVREEVVVSTLDEFNFNDSKIFLKVDVQGHENSLLAGATQTLQNVVIMEIESSFTPLYENETPHHELISRLTGLGFVPISFGNIHQDPSGRVWQLDTLLVKSDYL